MNASRTDFTRQIDYKAIKDGQLQLNNAVLRLIKGIRGPRYNPIHLQDILDWFRGATVEMVCTAIHQHEDDNLIVKVSGGYRMKTFGDMMGKGKSNKATRPKRCKDGSFDNNPGPIDRVHLMVLNEIANPKQR
jgi:hypothetical protein